MGNSSEAPGFDEVANYPLACRERFLALTAALATASSGRRLHFILPDVDKVLDDFLAWLAVYGD